MYSLNKILVRSLLFTRVCSYSCYSPEVIFSDKSKHDCLQKFKSMLPVKIGKASTRRAAVLIPLCMHKKQVSLLYTLRSADLTTHRGQVSFPGGMSEGNDESLEYTALRETYEELGIPPGDVEIWGSGNFIITRQNMSIYPVIGCLRTDFAMENLSLCDREVEEVFVVPLRDLCNPNLHGFTQFRNTYSTPVFFGGQHRIWGLTAVITHMFLKSLLPITAYKHIITYIPNIICR